jgi:hypothetical protein
VAYLGRPCQYLGGDRTAECSQAYGTNKRFVVEVVAATTAAIDSLKRRFDVRQFTWWANQEGGAVAALVATQRTDGTLLVTVAGNLDHKACAEHFCVMPLYGSLDLADFPGPLATVKRVPWAGAADRVVPPLVTQSYAQRFSPSQKPTIRILEDYDHACCWTKNWAPLWTSIQ